MILDLKKIINIKNKNDIKKYNLSVPLFNNNYLFHYLIILKNLDGLKIVIPQVINQEFNQLHIVLGLVNDKKLEEILPLFPKNAIYYFCTPNIPRGLSVALLHEKARTFNLNGKVYTSVSAAYEAAKKGALRDDFIFVGGSTFVVAEIL